MLRRTLSVAFIGGLLMWNLGFAGTTSSPRSGTPSSGGTTTETPATTTPSGGTTTPSGTSTSPRVVGIPACQQPSPVNAQTHPAEEVCCDKVTIDGLGTGPALLHVGAVFHCGDGRYGMAHGVSPEVTSVQGKATFAKTCTALPSQADCPEGKTLEFLPLTGLVIEHPKGTQSPLGTFVWGE